MPKTDIKKRDALKDELYSEIAATLLEPQYSAYSKIDLEKKKEKLKNSIYILREHSIEYYFIEKDFLKEFANDKEKLEYAIKCYECQYRSQLEQAYCGNNQLNNFQNNFQPKRFLEGFPDAKERDRVKKEESLKSKWNNLSEECDCLNKYKINNYLNVREEIIENIKQFCIEGGNIFEHIITNNNLEILKQYKISELIDLLESFITQVNN